MTSPQVSEAEVEAAAKAIMKSHMIDRPKLPWPCWMGLARAALTAAAQVRERADDAEKDLMQDALMQIYQWSRAYPLKVFPEPDFKKAAKLLKAGGITLDAISASNMRHVVEGVGKIAAHALASYLPPAQPGLMPIYGATEPDSVLGEQKGEE